MLGSALASPFMMVAGLLWPGYQTYKAVGMDNPNQLREWCVYWVVMSFFLAVQTITDLTVFWLPLYYEAKLVLVLFLWHPKTKGAVYLFERFLHPLLRSHEARIDSGLEESKAWVADSFSRQVNRLREYSSQNMGMLLDNMRAFSEPRLGPEGSAGAAGPAHAHRD